MTGRARRRRGIGGASAEATLPPIVNPRPGRRRGKPIGNTSQQTMPAAFDNNNVTNTCSHYSSQSGGSRQSSVRRSRRSKPIDNTSQHRPLNSSNNNVGNGRVSGRRRKPHRAVVTREAPAKMQNHSDNDDSDNDETDSDDEELQMPPLVPRGYDSDDSESEDEDEPAAAKINRRRHKSSTISTPTTFLPTDARHKSSTKSTPTSNDLPTADRHKSSTKSNHHHPTTRSGSSLRSIGLKVAGFDDKRQQNVCERTNNERFSASFGVSAKTLEAVFLDMKKKDSTLTERDFLMAVDTLKLYLTEHNMAGRWQCCEETYRNKWKKVVKAIADLRGQKIKFDPSDFPEDQIFLLTVDGVNFTINEPRVNNPGSHWYDHKSHSAGLSYLVAVDVRRSRICWIDGPRPGKLKLLFYIVIISPWN